MTDITFIRTHEGWLHLAVVLDLFSRQVVGWSISSRIDTELAMNALLIAVWRRKSADPIMVHSDQGSSVHLQGLARVLDGASAGSKHEATR